MCYDIKASLNAQMKRARHYGDVKAIKEIEEKLIPLTDLPLFHGSGFRHPRLLIYTGRSLYFPEVASWGLVPHWVKDGEQRKKIWNNTINARGETIVEKPAFRETARNNRCIIPVDGFYEHHHYKGKTYPFYIHKKNRGPLSLAGLWNEWADPGSDEIMNTFTIVTTTANLLLARIHNNPKVEGPRMPVILPEELEEKWLSKVEDELDIKGIKELVQPYPELVF